MNMTQLFEGFNVELDFDVQVKWNITGLAEFAAAWLVDSRVNSGFSMVGILASRLFRETLSNALDPENAKTLQILNFTSSYLYTISFDDSTIHSQAVLAEQQIILALDLLLEPKTLATLTKDQLSALFLVLLGMTISTTYLEEFYFSPPHFAAASVQNRACDEELSGNRNGIFSARDASKVPDERGTSELIRLLCHYLAYIGQQIALLDDEFDPRAIIEHAQQRWNKDPGFYWSDSFNQNIMPVPRDDFLCSTPFKSSDICNTILEPPSLSLDSHLLPRPDGLFSEMDFNFLNDLTTTNPLSDDFPLDFQEGPNSKAISTEIEDSRKLIPWVPGTSSGSTYVDPRLLCQPGTFVGQLDFDPVVDLGIPVSPSGEFILSPEEAPEFLNMITEIEMTQTETSQILGPESFTDNVECEISRATLQSESLESDLPVLNVFPWTQDWFQSNRENSNYHNAAFESGTQQKLSAPQTQILPTSTYPSAWKLSPHNPRVQNTIEIHAIPGIFDGWQSIPDENVSLQPNVETVPSSTIQKSSPHLGLPRRKTFHEELTCRSAISTTEGVHLGHKKIVCSPPRARGCCVCGRMFMRVDNMKRHQRHCDLGSPRKNACSYCTKAFNSAVGCARHEESVHGRALTRLLI
jgi:hypothetical protein